MTQFTSPVSYCPSRISNLKPFIWNGHCFKKNFSNSCGSQSQQQHYSALFQSKVSSKIQKLSCAKPQLRVVSSTESVSEYGKGAEAQKKELIRLVGRTNRGKNTTWEERKHILGLIEKLEKLNPTSNPATSSLISGRWALLYTATVDEETVDKYAGTEEGPFLARVKPLSFGAVKQKGSIQVIDADNGLVENMAEFVILGIPGKLNIKGSCKQPGKESEQGTRLYVTFDSFDLTLKESLLFSVPLSWINPKGWVDTTYVDNDFRIGRGDKGSVFVTSRIKQ